MDFLTVLKNVLAVVETAALIGALAFSGKGIRERKDNAFRKSQLTKAAVCFAVYIVLNFIRLLYLQ